jgi:hypothetical protein
MKYLHLFSLFILSLVFAAAAQAQDKPTKTKVKKEKVKPKHPPLLFHDFSTVIKGKLKEKSWTKSTQNYCTQDSSYLVLVEENGKEHILDFPANRPSADQYKRWLNKTVHLKGDFVNRPIKANKDEMPPDTKEISSDFTCIVFTVRYMVRKR